MPTTNNKAVVTHIYPKMSFVLGERDAAGNFIPEPQQKPISHETAGDVWYELRELTFEEEPGFIYVLTHDLHKDTEEYFTTVMQKDDCVMSAVQFASAYQVERGITNEKGEFVPDPVKGKPIAKNLSSKWCAEHVIRKFKDYNSPITALVLFQPEEWQLEYLNKVVNGCPGLPIYIFHTYHCDKYGVEREGNNIGASLWDTQSEMTEERELQPVIEHVAHEGESTWIFGYAKHGKTWIWLCVVKALLTGEPLFNVPDLKVPCKSKRVIYLCPEAGRTSLRKRLKVLGLMEYLYDPITNPEGRLYLRSLSKGAKLKLDDPKLFELAKGADIFIDTAVRYLEGDENSSGDVKVLTENILNLLAMGARSMWVAHHSGKSFASATEITLENCARGSSEFAAALTNAIGVVQLDKDKNLVHFHFIDGRDMDEPVKDMHLLGRPYLSQVGNFQVTENVERFKGRNNKSGPKDDPEKQAKIEFVKSIEGSLQEKADAIEKQFGVKHDRSTISKWLKEGKKTQGLKSDDLPTSEVFNTTKES